MNKRVIGLTLAVLCLFTGFAACKKQEDPPIDITASGAYTPSELPIPDPASGEGTRTLTISMPAQYDTLHPLSASADISNLLSLILEPGLRITSDGKLEANLISEWDVSEDGLTYTFYMRENLTAHDGSPLTAGDLYYTIETIRSAGAGKTDYARYTKDIESVERLSEENAVKIVTTKKTRDVLYLVTAPILLSNHYSQISLDSKSHTPVGTGPYKVEHYSEAEGFKLVRNETWWKAAPYYERINAVPVDMDALTMGSDVMDRLDVLTTEKIVAGTYSSAGKTTVHTSMTPNLECIIPNMNRRLAQEKPVRQAISFALNRSSLISNSVMGLGEPTATPQKPGLWAFTSESYDAIYNIAKANDILDAAGYIVDEDDPGARRYTSNADGTKRYLSLELLYYEPTGFEYRRTLVQLLADDMKSLGIELKLTKVSPEVYAERVGKKDFDLLLCNFYMGMNNDISPLFEDYNYGSYSYANLSPYMSACVTAVSESEAKTAFNELQEQLLEEMPIIGLFYRSTAVVADVNISLSNHLIYKNLFGTINEWDDTGN